MAESISFFFMIVLWFCAKICFFADKAFAECFFCSKFENKACVPCKSVVFLMDQNLANHLPKRLFSCHDDDMSQS
ncbi:hypothetical protein HMPREF1640_05885 [Prevotella sp. S7-1-8]|nr:hypothetical protein HMPREF1640_05885 [Prevotella sp. S7-1-8]